MTTLVTGASGFIGSAVARRLLEAGHRVRILVRRSSDLRNIAELPVETAIGDLTDAASLAQALSRCTALFHVAADYRLWAPDPNALYRTNVTGTENIMRAALAAGVERIVYTSSVATLGLTADGKPADEDTPVSPADMIGHYKRSKFFAEEAIRRMVRDENLPAVIVNPSTPVGPRDIKPTPTGQMIREAAMGRMPAYVDTGLNLVHVDDVATGHLLAFEHGTIGERYILGGRNMSLKEIFEEIGRITGRPAPRLRLPHNLVLPVAYLLEAWVRVTRNGEPRITVDGVRLAKKYMYYSTAKAERELGYRARPVEQGLVDAVHWFQQNGFLR